MAYRTYFSINSIEEKIDGLWTNIHPEKFKAIILKWRENNEDADFIDEYDGSAVDEMTWYDFVDDALILSKEYPDYLFSFHGIGEESDDIWDHYFLNGLNYRQYIIMPEFNEKLLK